jgi:hypothetical protein
MTGFFCRAGGRYLWRSMACFVLTAGGIERVSWIYRLACAMGKLISRQLQAEVAQYSEIDPRPL